MYQIKNKISALGARECKKLIITRIYWFIYIKKSVELGHPPGQILRGCNPPTPSGDLHHITPNGYQALASSCPGRLVMSKTVAHFLLICTGNGRLS